MADDVATARVNPNGGPQVIVTGREGLIADVAEKALALPPLKAITMAVLAAALMVVFTCCYVVWDSRTTLIGILAKATADRVEAERTKTHATALTDFVVRERQYSSLLSSTRRDLNAARALLFEFHNGTESLRGMPFLFQSATGEDAAQGISHELDNLKRMPLEITSGYVQSFIKGDCVRLATADAPPPLAQLMKNVGTEVNFACPVYPDASKEPTGYVSVSYQHGWTVPETEGVFMRLRTTAAALGAIQGAYLDSMGKH